MTDIANEADVSVESVHATGAKVTLLLESFRHALVHHDESTAAFDVDEADDVLGRLLDLVVTEHARSARIMMEVRHVALTHEKVAKEWSAQLEARRREARVRAERLLAAGVVGDGPGVEEADRFVATVSNLMSAETYVQLTQDWGFDTDQYRAWLRRQLHGLRA